jgi:uncharacterized SAM-binding protein YcdF (DUF218 family)
MTDLPAKSPTAARRDLQRERAMVGAALGGLLGLEIIALGIPRILVGTAGFNALPLAVIVGALLGLTTTRRWLLVTVTGLGAVLAVIAYTPIVRRPARALVRSDPVGGRPLEAIVVLSGGVTPDGNLEPRALDRVLTGLSLVRRGIASTLIVSRVRWGRSGRGVTSDADQQRLIALLERPVRLLIVDSVFSTRDEAVRMRALARALDITSIAVVTSPLHTYRACAAFEKVGFAVTCVPSESRDVALRTLRRGTDRVLAFQLWLYEWAALLKYRASGWI